MQISNPASIIPIQAAKTRRRLNLSTSLGKIETDTKLMTIFTLENREQVDFPK